MMEGYPGYQPNDYGYTPAAVPKPIPHASGLLLFGGQNHNVFLGCLNCSKYDSGSVWNKFGDYGSKFSDKSIWNKFGTYGSKFSDESPWNRFGQTPPVIVDREGNFYGYFTVNTLFPKRTLDAAMLQILNDYENIMENFDAVVDSLR